MGSDRVVQSVDDPDDIETVRTGFFTYRAGRHAPLQAIRVIWDDGWYVFRNSHLVEGSGARLAKDIAFLLWHAPFHEISEREYDQLLQAYARAGPGHPLTTPDQPVNLRDAPALYGRNSDAV